MGDEDIALGPSASGSDEGPEGVWGAKCFLGLFCPALKVSSNLLVRDWSNLLKS